MVIRDQAHYFISLILVILGVTKKEDDWILKLLQLEQRIFPHTLRTVK